MVQVRRAGLPAWRELHRQRRRRFHRVLAAAVLGILGAPGAVIAGNLVFGLLTGAGGASGQW